MLQLSRKPYVCWRCLTAGNSGGVLLSRSSEPRRQTRSVPHSRIGHLYQPGRVRGITTSQSQGRLDNQRDESALDQPEDPHLRIGIRERLRIWERENPSPAEQVLEDRPAAQSWGNFLTRPQTARTYSDEQAILLESPDLFEGDVLSDLRRPTTGLLPGDLVETRFDGSRLPVLGICIGRHHGHQYFYMNTGELLPYQSLASTFTVNNYVDPSLLLPLAELLPEQPFTKPRNVLQHVRTPQALEAASLLQKKLTQFYADTVSFYQSALKFIERASEQVADPVKVQYMSLEELTERILPAFLKNRGTFSAHNLYAVHLALQRDGWGFRPLSERWHRRNYIYEVRPSSDKRLLEKVEEDARELIDGAYLRPGSAQLASLWEKNNLGRFIRRAREAINISRTTREPTPNGMVGPMSGPALDMPPWEKSDLDYIRFMELWACHRIVSKSSQVDSLASTILRLTQMYKDGSWVAHWTGVTFLQEIGWISPWDIQARYGYRFPGVDITPSGRLRRPEVDVKGSLREDIAVDTRKDWGNTTVFCVDSDQTTDVDDGFSVETTDTPGEYWVHVHIADPASRIEPTSQLAVQLQQLPSSLYLPGFSERMLPEELEQTFSLDPEKPTLTFSAKVNDMGEVLDYEVKPGVAHNVVHMTKEEASSLLPSQEPADPQAGGYLSVGQKPSTPPPVKKLITKASDLAQKDRDDLALIDRLAEALRNRRREKGQLPHMESRLPTPSVSFHEVTGVHQTPPAESSQTWAGDPFIEFGRSAYGRSEQLVETLMHTAGEIAAMWCQSRNIAVPYSTQPEAVRNAAELEKLRKEVVDPLTASGKPLPPRLRQELFSLIGTSELSSAPGPFYSTGLDVYTKSSSPLRRFTDLVVHWQIHAALAQERKMGISLAGTDCSEAAFLPWTPSTLGPLLPALQARQRQIREVDNRDGPSQWIFQALVRAWRFGEAPLPATFAFEIDAVLPTGLKGRLSDFHNLPAMLPLTLMEIGARLADTAVGDVIDVEIADINVVMMRIDVQRPKSKSGADGPGIHEETAGAQ